jgi:hypothetical protein
MECGDLHRVLSVQLSGSQKGTVKTIGNAELAASR